MGHGSVRVALCGIAAIGHFAEDLSDIVIGDAAVAFKPCPSAFLGKAQFLEPQPAGLARDIILLGEENDPAPGGFAGDLLQLAEAFREALGGRQECSAKYVGIAFIA